MCHRQMDRALSSSGKARCPAQHPSGPVPTPTQHTQQRGPMPVMLRLGSLVLGFLRSGSLRLGTQMRTNRTSDRPNKSEQRPQEHTVTPQVTQLSSEGPGDLGPQCHEPPLSHITDLCLLLAEWAVFPHSSYPNRDLPFYSWSSALYKDSSNQKNGVTSQSCTN